jgi:hypothetical protein
MHGNYQRQRQAYKVPPANEPWLGLMLWITAASAKKAGAAIKNSRIFSMAVLLCVLDAVHHVCCAVDAMYCNFRS